MEEAHNEDDAVHAPLKLVAAERALPFSFGDTRLLELVFDKLSDKLDEAQLQELLDDMRQELYANIGNYSLKDLHRITLGCTRCPNVASSPQLPKWNLSDPDMVLVGEAPLLDGEPTKVLIDVLRAAKFSSKRIAYTSVNRCHVDRRKYEQEEIENCGGFLLTELQLLKPRLIVPLGLIATSVVMGTGIKLSDLRGNINWLGPWAIMPTYSPLHVLRGAEHLMDVLSNDIKTAYRFCYGDT